MVRLSNSALRRLFSIVCPGVLDGFCHSFFCRCQPHLRISSSYSYSRSHYTQNPGKSCKGLLNNELINSYSFYCIVLLTTLFVSSCYWQPFPVDNPLTTPWSENITTFADALHASLPSNYTRPLPSVMRAVDRCWCDFSGNFFEPFNVSHWEYLSIQRVSQDLLRQEKLGSNASNERKGQQENQLVLPHAARGLGFSLHPLHSHKFWSLFFRPSYRRKSYNLKHANSQTRSPTAVDVSLSVVTTTPPSSSLEGRLRWECDLRPYGLGMIVDLGW